MGPNCEQLQACSLFRGIGPGDLERMVDCMSVRHRDYAKGEYVLMADTPATSIGIVLHGSVHVISEDYWGNRSILSQVGGGGVFAEAFSCADVSKMPISVVAAERSAVAFLDYRRATVICENACGFHLTLIQNMLRLIAGNNLILTEKISHLAKRTTREKLLSYLSEQAVAASSSEFEIPFNRQELADYLCVDRSAMSTELSRLKREGLLDYQKNRFRLSEQ